MCWNGRISKAIEDPRTYLWLDDTILKTIEHSEERGMSKARELVRRIRRRELYQYVNEYSVPSDRLTHFKPVTAEDIVSCQDANGVIPGGLKPDDIVVQNLKIDYAKGDCNPVDSVRFFQHWNDETSFTIDREKVSRLLPSTFLERRVRVFSKHAKKEYFDAVEHAFSNHQRQVYDSEVQLTPARKRGRRA